METNESISSLWQQVVEELRSNADVTPRQMGFINLVEAQGLLGNTVLLTAPNEMTREVLETGANVALKEALVKVFSAEINCAISIDSQMQPKNSMPSITSEPEHLVDNSVDTSVEDGGKPEDLFHQEADAPQISASDPDEDPTAHLSSKTNPAPTAFKESSAASESEERSRLNPRYNFETFVTGKSNRFPHAAAYAVAEAPARAYNPLFIYGESGLGKTHLLHAIGHYARELFSGLRVRYVNSEEFTNDFINSIRHDQGASFKQIYRNVDILLIDDIQFMANKEATVEEFFHTFNALYNNNKQLVITSDLPPKQLSGFEDRLRSRFEWGLTVDIQPPDLETRIAILSKKAEAERLSVPQEALQYIAERISTNIRELEGALTRVNAFASLNKQEVDIPLAEHVLKDLITDDDAAEITAAQIVNETARYFGFSMDDMLSKSRTRTLVTARQIAMYLLRELTEMSLPKIGHELGGRDHTTVMHADRKIRDLMAERRNIYNQVTELTNRIKQNARRL